MKYRIIIFSLLILLPSILWSQKEPSIDCKEKLNEVREEFERGRPHRVYQLLIDSTGNIHGACEPCLNDKIEGFSEIDQYELYEKLILSIIYMGFEDVSPYMNDFLGEHPLYIPAYKESALRNLYNQFNTNSVFIVGVSLSLGSSPVFPLERYSLAYNQNKKGLYSAPFSNIRMALKLGIPLSHSFELGFDPAYFSQGYKYQENLVHSNSIPSDPLNTLGSNNGFTTSTLSFQENQTWVGLPLYIRYHFGTKKKKKEYSKEEWDKRKKEKIKFNLFTGAEANFLINASLKNIVRTLSDNPSQSVQGDNISLFSNSIGDPPQLRNSNNLSLFFGAGISKNIKKWRIGMDFRLGWMLANQVKIANRYANNDLLYLYGHVDNDFKISDVSIALSFQYRVFKPRKVGRKNRDLGYAENNASIKNRKKGKEAKKAPTEIKKEIAQEVEKISENEKLMEEIEKKMNELEELKYKAEKMENKLKGMTKGEDRDDLELMLKTLKENIETLEEKIKAKRNE